MAIIGGISYSPKARQDVQLNVRKDSHITAERWEDFHRRLMDLGKEFGITFERTSANAARRAAAKQPVRKPVKRKAKKKAVKKAPARKRGR